MADSASHAIPEQPSTGAPGRLSRRGLLKGAAVTMGAAALGAGAAGTAAAADASVTATAPDGSNTITMSLTSGALSWSAKRRGVTVVDTSALGLQAERRDGPRRRRHGDHQLPALDHRQHLDPGVRPQRDRPRPVPGDALEPPGHRLPDQLQRPDPRLPDRRRLPVRTARQGHRHHRRRADHVRLPRQHPGLQRA